MYFLSALTLLPFQFIGIDIYGKRIMSVLINCEKHHFEQVDDENKNILLRKYWSIPERQVETSVVLADDKWNTETK